MNFLKLIWVKSKIHCGLNGPVVWALIPLLTWSIYLFGVWPGSLSVDSTITLKFSEQGYFDQSHSLIYTLHFILARLLFDSPGAIAISQILLLSFAHGYAMATLKTLGTNTWILFTATIIVALSPLNGFMVSTLWKDVGYATWFYILFACLIRIVSSKGEWLNKTTNLVFFCCCCVLLAAYRETGYLVVFATIAGLSLIKELRWRRLLTITGAYLTFVLCWLIAVNALFAPPKYNYWTSGKSNPVHLLASSYEKGYLSEDEQATLDKIKPENLTYNCRNSAGLMFNSPFVSVFHIHYYFEHLASIWLNQVMAHPEIYWEHVACGSKFIVVPWRTGGLYHINHGIKGLKLNPFNYHYGTDEGPEVVQKTLAQIYQWSRLEPLKTVLWWPGFSLWLILICASIQSFRTRDTDWLLLAIPIFVHSILLAALVPNDHTRYQYSVLLCMPVGLLVLFTGSSSTGIFQIKREFDYHRLFIILGTLIALTALIKTTSTRTWDKKIYESLDTTGIYLQESRPAIDHRKGNVFQDGRQHYLLYQSCIHLKKETAITIHSAQLKEINLTIGDKQIDLGTSDKITLQQGHYLVRVGYKKILVEPGFQMLDTATSKAIQTALPREGQCL